MSRASRRNHFNARTFWLRYGLCLAQVLVVVAYLLPWERVYADFTYEGLISWVYSRLTHDPSTHQALLMVSLIICFMAAIVSFLITIIVFVKKNERTSALRASSMLTSIALAGPLLWIHGHLPQSGSGLSELSHSISEVGIGWFIAVLCGSAACLLSVYISCGVGGRTEKGVLSKEHSRCEPSVACFFLMPVFMIVTILGFFLPWSSGSMTSWWSQFTWSVSGFEVSPLMYLVPVAASMSVVSLIPGDSVDMMRGRVFSELAGNLLAVSFALTLFWGLAFGEADSLVPDAYRNADLQLGWYLCTLGLLVMFVCMLLPYGPHPQKAKVSLGLARKNRV